jgi:hypothetical protein
MSWLLRSVLIIRQEEVIFGCDDFERSTRDHFVQREGRGLLVVLQGPRNVSERITADGIRT